MTTDTAQFKAALEKECTELETQLKGLGRKNPDNAEDWEAVEPAMNEDPAEEAEVAEVISAYENNSAVLNNLEIRLNEVKAALEKINAGTFGTCEVCGAQIEEDRLEANPAAKTCKAHMEI